MMRTRGKELARLLLQTRYGDLVGMVMIACACLVEAKFRYLVVKEVVQQKSITTTTGAPPVKNHSVRRLGGATATTRRKLLLHT